MNPGPRYLVKSPTSGVTTTGLFMASSREAVVQCEVGNVFLGRRDRATKEDDEKQAAAGRLLSEDKTTQDDAAHVDPEMFRGDGFDDRQVESARQIVRYARLHERSKMPARPPLKCPVRHGEQRQQSILCGRCRYSTECIGQQSGRS